MRKQKIKSKGPVIIRLPDGGLTSSLHLHTQALTCGQWSSWDGFDSRRLKFPWYYIPVMDNRGEEWWDGGFCRSITDA